VQGQTLISQVHHCTVPVTRLANLFVIEPNTAQWSPFISYLRKNTSPRLNSRFRHDYEIADPPEPRGCLSRWRNSPSCVTRCAMLILFELNLLICHRAMFFSTSIVRISPGLVHEGRTFNGRNRRIQQQAILEFLPEFRWQRGTWSWAGT
jgi:hypothetical protein